MIAIVFQSVSRALHDECMPCERAALLETAESSPFGSEHRLASRVHVPQASAAAAASATVPLCREGATMPRSPRSPNAATIVP